MTEEEAWQAIEVGYDSAKEEIARGVRCLIVGELGIGNKTPSSAILSVLLDIDPQSVVNGFFVFV